MNDYKGNELLPSSIHIIWRGNTHVAAGDKMHCLASERFHKIVAFKNEVFIVMRAMEQVRRVI